MKVIGFADKYYTLWEVNSDVRQFDNYKEVVTHNTYIKNISKSLDKVKALYPNVEISESLRGHTISWESTKKVYDNIDTFRFGKYEGQKIEKINDVNYTAWYWEQIYDEHKVFVSEYLKKNGYEIRTRSWKTYEGYEYVEEYLMSPESLAIEKTEAEQLIADENLLKSGVVLSFICEYNLNEDGEVCNGNLTYKFPEIKEMSYRGWPYWLPVKNGKAKRIKNKTITINKYSFEKNDYGFTVNVIDFEINK